MTADRAAEERLVEAMAGELRRHNDTLDRARRAWVCSCGADICDFGATDAGKQWRAHVAAALLAGPVGAALAAAKREAWGEGHMTHHDDNPCVTDENPYRAAGVER